MTINCDQDASGTCRSRCHSPLDPDDPDSLSTALSSHKKLSTAVEILSPDKRCRVTTARATPGSCHEPTSSRKTCHVRSPAARCSSQSSSLLKFPGTFLASIAVNIAQSHAQVAEDTTASSSVPQALIIVICIVAFVIIGAVIAKCVEYCHDRRTISDNSSDISDYTRELLKAQMMLMMFNRSRKGRRKLKPEECALKYSKMWRAKVARNKARRLKKEKGEDTADKKHKTSALVVNEKKTQNGRVASGRASPSAPTISSANKMALTPKSPRPTTAKSQEPGAMSLKKS